MHDLHDPKNPDIVVPVHQPTLIISAKPIIFYVVDRTTLLCALIYIRLEFMSLDRKCKQQHIAQVYPKKILCISS